MSGTTFTYNGITIYNVLTDDISSQVTMDRTGVNPVSIKVSMTFTGIAHVWDFSGTGGNIDLGVYAGEGHPDESLGGLYSIIRALNTPRRALLYKIGDIELYNVKPVDTDDAASRYATATGVRPAINSSPQVKAQVTRVINQNAVWLRITAEFEYLPCDYVSISDGVGNVLSLRWKTVDNIDAKTWLTRRVITGSIQCKSGAYSPHMLRYLAFPPIDAGWRVEDIEFAEGDDNRTLDFSISYSQVIEQPPWPATDWSGEVEVDAPMGGIGMKTIVMSLELTGHPTASKYELVLLALEIFDAKIGWYDQTASGAMFCRRLLVKESIGENKVSGQLVVDVFQHLSSGGDHDYQSALNYHNLLKGIFSNDMRDPFFAASGEDIDRWWKRNSVTTTNPDGSTQTKYQGPGWAYLKDYHPALPSVWLPMVNSLLSVFVPRFAGLCSTPADASSPKTRAWTGSVPTIAGTDVIYIPEQSVPPDVGGSNAGGSNGSSAPSVPGQTETTLIQDRESPYLSYEMWTRYMEDTGLRGYSMTPNSLNVDQPTVAMARLRTPQTSMRVEWEAVRINRWPEYPTPEPWVDPETGIVFACQKHEVGTKNAIQSADGRKIAYAMEGKATYLMSRSYGTNERRFVVTPPVVSGDAESDHDDVEYLGNDNARDAGQWRPGGSPQTPPPSGGNPSTPPEPVP